jgi:predicted small lipoprotein YifL
MSPRLTLWACAVALALSAPLAACGKLGQLQRPGPLNGVESATTQQADERVRKATDPSLPVDTIDPRDQVIDPRPPRTLPIPGTNPSANDVALPGALPDPYANPPR